MVDRLEMIRRSAEKINFKKNLQNKSKKMLKNRSVKEPTEQIEMEYNFSYTDKIIARDSGISDTFYYTTKFDSEWN